eukprot:656945-Rhodomonas_salina.1
MLDVLLGPSLAVYYRLFSRWLTALDRLQVECRHPLYLELGGNYLAINQPAVLGNKGSLAFYFGHRG